MPRVKFLIKPNILNQLVSTSGFDINELAKYLGISNEKMIMWTKEDSYISKTNLKKLATKLRRPQTAFFLKNLPKEMELIDFRTIQNSKKKFSNETLTAIRTSRYLQTASKNLMILRNTNLKPKIKSKITVNSNPEEIAKDMREKLHLDELCADLTATKSNLGEFYNRLRENVEALNIFVFQARIPIDESRGFTLAAKLPRIITISSKDITAAKIFTLLHELGHVLLRSDGICLFEDENINPSKYHSVETWCNNFASSTLMPKIRFIKKFDILKKIGYSDEIILKELALHFRVSDKAISVRIKTLSLGFNYNYEPVINNDKKPSGGPPMHVMCISQKGKKFSAMVIESNELNLINIRDMVHLLNLKPKHYDHLMESVYS